MSVILKGVLIGGAIGVAFTLMELFFWSRLFTVGAPWELLVMSGKQYVSAGTRRSFKVIPGGGTVQVPIVERSETMDCSLRSALAKIRGAYSKGATALNISFSVLYRISMDPAISPNAVELILRPTLWPSRMAAPL